MKNNIGAIVISGLWIAISEFVRNAFLFNYYWRDHSQASGNNHSRIKAKLIIFIYI